MYWKTGNRQQFHKHPLVSWLSSDKRHFEVDIFKLTAQNKNIDEKQKHINNIVSMDWSIWNDRIKFWPKSHPPSTDINIIWWLNRDLFILLKVYESVQLETVKWPLRVNFENDLQPFANYTNQTIFHRASLMICCAMRIDSL